MDISKYHEFLECQSTGKKEAARSALREFITSFQDDGEVENWVWEYLPQLVFNGASKIRHELFEELVFPVLRAGYESEDLQSTLWLGKLILNVYAVTSFHEELHQVSDRELFERCLALYPNHEEARTLLLGSLLKALAYTNHEWPSGLLHGMNGANLEQCRDIRSDIVLARSLNPNAEQGAFLAEVERNLNAYEARLAEAER
ncbi:MAG: hypothetical protein U0136_06570 [Bdellovibrionota bacterium]